MEQPTVTEQHTPKGMRLHIGLFGRTNVGKSSLLNAVTGQEVAIVSATPGTTTDPVEKAMELLPIGPVLFIDTGGVDDQQTLARQRIAHTLRVIDRTDLALLVTEPDTWGEYEENLLQRLRERAVPVLVVINKSDLGPLAPRTRELLSERKVPCVEVSAQGSGWETTARVKAAMLELVPEEWLNSRPVVADLVRPNDTVLLVIPLDEQSPKGRLILPEQIVIRELLDAGARPYLCGPEQVESSLAMLHLPPRLVVTDSQALGAVLRATPAEIPLTTFSVLMARHKGDLEALAEGARALEKLNAGSKVLIAEACTHHPGGEDIGRVKIPGLLRRKVGEGLQIDVVSGRNFPTDVSGYDLVIHCGGCTLNRRGMLSRILLCRQQGTPITNYGMTIGHLHGNLERVLRPFAVLNPVRLAA